MNKIEYNETTPSDTKHNENYKSNDFTEVISVNIFIDNTYYVNNWQKKRLLTDAIKHTKTNKRLLWLFILISYFTKLTGVN